MLKRTLLVILAAFCTAVIAFAATIGGSMIDVGVLMESNERLEAFADVGPRFTGHDGNKLRAESRNGDAELRVRIVALETNVSWIQTTMREVVSELKDISRRLTTEVDRLERQNGGPG